MAPFKAIAVLQTQGLRIHAEPEPLHNYWNATKAAIQKSGLEPALLVGVLLSRVDHGPFLSGSNWVAKNECMCKLVSEMSDSQFDDLVEDMAFDRARLHDTDSLDLNENLPEEKEDLLAEPAVTTTGIFASGLALDPLNSCSPLHLRLRLKWTHLRPRKSRGSNPSLHCGS